MRGRVFSSFYVMRDVVFLFGMAGAGLADIVDIRLLIVVASSLLFVSAAFTLVAPGLGVSTWGAAAARLRGATAAPAVGGADRGPRRSPTSTGWPVGSARSPGSSPDQRVGLRPRRPRSSRSPGGTRIVEHGDAATSAYFILDGSTTAGVPVDDGFRGPLDDDRRRLLRRDRGADRQPSDRRRRRRRRHDPARGPGRRAARDDGRAGDPAASSCRR